MEERDPSVHKNFKLPSGLVDYMMKDIKDAQEHRNASEYITQALHEYVEKRKLLKMGYVVSVSRRDP
jgi:Arc/MetJ-type ribon-helix-helix transcriptional regulator